MDRYLIVIEGDGTTNYSAYAPDLPGCVATGPARDVCERAMQEAVGLHLSSLRRHGEPVPSPLSSAAYVEA